MSDLSIHFHLKNARTHEVFGPNALSFAFASAGQNGGSVMWISESWQAVQINPVGFSTYLNPQNLLISKAIDQDEALAACGLRDAIKRISRERRRFGYRRIHVMAEREGHIEAVASGHWARESDGAAPPSHGLLANHERGAANPKRIH